MSVPVLPRYVVGDVTGWKITAATMDGSRRPSGNPPTLWYVQDRLNGHRTVAEFITGGYVPRTRAHLHCEKLNREYEQWLRDEGLVW